MRTVVNLLFAVLAGESVRTLTRIPALTGVSARAAILAGLVVCAVIQI